MKPDLFYLCAPSGAGKDAFLTALKQQAGAPHVVVRTITRPADPSEQSEAVSEMEFLNLKTRGQFALDWSANGFHYGIRVSELNSHPAAILNGSRVYWPTARSRLPHLKLVTIEVPDAILKHRLEARGRESEFEIHARLRRNRELAGALAEERPYLTLINDGTPEDMAIAFMEHIRC